MCAISSGNREIGGRSFTRLGRCMGG